MDKDFALNESQVTIQSCRSENCVKNRFYGSLRKVLRKMNKAAKSLVKKFKK